MCGHHIQQSTNQLGKVANSVYGQLNREKFPCPRSRLRIWLRETGLAVPSLVSLLILYTNAESGASSRYSSRIPRRRPYVMTRDMLTVTLRQDDGLIKPAGGNSVILPSKSTTPLLGILYGQARPFSSQFPENNNQRRERFPEHLRDPVHQHLQQRTSKLLRVSCVVKAFDRSSLNLRLVQSLAPIGLICGCIVPYCTVPPLPCVLNTSRHNLRFLGPSSNPKLFP